MRTREDMRNKIKKQEEVTSLPGVFFFIISFNYILNFISKLNYNKNSLLLDYQSVT